MTYTNNSFQRAIAGFSILLLAFSSWFGFTIHAEASVVADYSAAQDGERFAQDGETNVFIGSFILPDPVEDTILTDGGSVAPSPKDELKSLSGYRYLDKDNDTDYDHEEGVIYTSNNGYIDSADTVIYEGVGVLTDMETTEVEGDFWIYADQNGNDSQLQTDEDLLQLVHSGANAAVASGNTLAAFADDDVHISVGGGGYFSNDRVILNDANEDQLFDSGDSVVVAGATGNQVFALDAADDVCFDASVSADTEYDVGEVIWYDVAGDCSAFTTTTDVILVGSAAPTGTSTEFGTEQEFGFVDSDDDNSYTCSRAGECEPVFYSGADSTDVTDNNLTTSIEFFDSSTEATDGIATTGTGWDESGASSVMTRLSASESSGESNMFYIDGDSSGGFDAGDDVFRVREFRGAQDIASGDTIRLFDSHKFSDLDGSGWSNSETIFVSADNDLDVGALDGTGTDEVVYSDGSSPPRFRTFGSEERFFEQDGDDLLENGEDIVLDVDESGYYNADELNDLEVNAQAGGSPITDANLTAVRIYRPSSSVCFGAGTDSLLGEDTSSPFLNQVIGVGASVLYAANDPVADRTVCVFADIADVGTHGDDWNLQIPQDGVTFLDSTNGGPTDGEFSVTTTAVQFVGTLSSVSIVAGDSDVSVTTSYTVTFDTNEDDVAASEFIVVDFPDTFDVSGASVSACTDDAVGFALTDTISSNEVRIQNDGGTIAAGSTVECVIDDVVNPSIGGSTAAFILKTSGTATTGALEVDESTTVTMTGATTGGSGSSGSGGGSTTYSMHVDAPNGGEVLTAGSVVEILWTPGGTGSLDYATINLSLDGGSTYTPIVTHTDNDGSYMWTVPDSSTDAARVRVDGTDLASVFATDASDTNFTIQGSATIEPTEPGGGMAEGSGEFGISPVTGELEELSVVTPGMYIRGASYDTVYQITDTMTRRPFLNEQIFFTWQDDFNGVVTVTDATLTTLSLGLPALPQAGTVWVKWQSIPDVFALEDQAGTERLLRRWVPSESVAEVLLGTDWADYVIDLPDTIYSHFDDGPEMTILDTIDKDSMVKRIGA